MQADGAVQDCAVQHPGRATAGKQVAVSVNHMDEILYRSVLALTNAKGEETISTWLTLRSFHTSGKLVLKWPFHLQACFFLYKLTGVPV